MQFRVALDDPVDTYSEGFEPKQMMLASTIKAAVMMAAPPASGPRGGGLPDAGK